MLGGPYRISRNPVYVGYLGLWLGWAIFLGSMAVSAGLVVLCVVASQLIVPAEERELVGQFGGAYEAYTRRVPRWLGRRGH